MEKEEKIIERILVEKNVAQDDVFYGLYELFNGLEYGWHYEGMEDLFGGLEYSKLLHFERKVQIKALEKEEKIIDRILVEKKKARTENLPPLRLFRIKELEKEEKIVDRILVEKKGALDDDFHGLFDLFELLE